MIKKISWLAICLAFLTWSLQAKAPPPHRVEVYNVRSYTHPSYTRIVIDVGQLREYVFNELKSPDRIYIDVFQAKLNPILHGQTIFVNNPYIQKIRIAQRTPQTVRVVVDLNFKQIKRYEVFPLPDPFRIVLDIYPRQTAASSQDIPPQPAKPTQSGYTLARQLGLGVHRIVLDPGHGGRDPGCIGRSGLKEKDVVLDVCLRLKKLLESKNQFEVILTRESDIYIPLENRTIIANQKRADLYISIHANANPNRRKKGIMSFYLNFSPDPTVNEIAARENATSSKNIGKMKEIILKIVQNSKIKESQELARAIQKSLITRLKKNFSAVKDMGVKGGPFWVLIGAEMPSVLVEISHLSNPTEESRLKTARYRQEIARGIYEGIINYVKSLGKG
ncbi:N-acetylmuramoyl-L-alanine amidase [Candidatus Aminicenantes bacterium AC-334-K16]|jgi:N-acetylmuramoyl-L-alanine amidase|nr:N-acetylmuramoyl-L-alanine amidase [Candidatus Aminicenantes bacterium AC-334-K16]